MRRSERGEDSTPWTRPSVSTIRKNFAWMPGTRRRYKFQHNETQPQDASKAERLLVKTHVRAGGESVHPARRWCRAELGSSCQRNESCSSQLSPASSRASPSTGHDATANTPNGRHLSSILPSREGRMLGRMKGRGVLALAETAHPDHLLMARTALYTSGSRGHWGGPRAHLAICGSGNGARHHACAWAVSLSALLCCWSSLIPERPTGAAGQPGSMAWTDQRRGVPS